MSRPSANVKKVDIELLMKRHLRESHGYIYLPAENVESARKAVVTAHDNVLACVKESKTGIKRFCVYKVGAARLWRLYEVVVRSDKGKQ